MNATKPSTADKQLATRRARRPALAAAALVAGGVVLLLLALFPTQVQALVASVTHRAPSDAQANIFNNPGFEDAWLPVPVPPHSAATVTGQIAGGWVDNSGWGDVTLRYDRDTAQPHGGRACQRIDIERVGGRVPWSFCQFAQITPLARGHYRASLWLRASRPTTLDVVMRQYGVPEFARTAQVGTAWQQVTLDADLPQTALTFFFLRTPQDGRSLWVDDADLERPSAATGRPLWPAVVAALGVIALAAGVVVRRRSRRADPEGSRDRAPLTMR